MGRNGRLDISLIVLLKLLTAYITYVAIVTIASNTSIDFNKFSYPDSIATYLNCNQNRTNILYTKLICAFGFEKQTIGTPIPITLALIINITVTISVYFSSWKLFTRKGQLLLIFLLTAHPYLALYAPRFYTDIFGCIGIALIYYKVANNKRIDLLFILCSLALMQFRNALIPAFFVFGLLEFLKNIKYSYKLSLYPIILCTFSFLNVLPNMEYAWKFFSAGSSIHPENYYTTYFYILHNIISLLSLREMHAVLGISEFFTLSQQPLALIQIAIAIGFFIVHLLGIIGLLFYQINKNISLLSIFFYFIPTIFSLSNMRYLLPCIPIIMVGLVLLFCSAKNIIRQECN